VRQPGGRDVEPRKELRPIHQAKKASPMRGEIRFGQGLIVVKMKQEESKMKRTTFNGSTVIYSRLCKVPLVQ
jgi:hypothetical protein